MDLTPSTSTNKSGKLELQPDDLEILRLLNQDFLLLTNEQIRQFFPNRSQRAIDGRLQKLIKAGYLSLRYPGKLFLKLNRPSYYLATKAMRNFQTGPSDKRPFLRSLRSRNFDDTGLIHLLFTNAVQIKFQTAGYEYPDYKFEGWIEQYDSVWARLNRDGFQLRQDGLAKAWKGTSRYLHFIEADRGTYL